MLAWYGWLGIVGSHQPCSGKVPADERATMALTFDGYVAVPFGRGLDRA